MALPLLPIIGVGLAAFLVGTTVMRDREKTPAPSGPLPSVDRSTEKRLEGKLKSIEEDVKDREGAEKLRDLELVAQQKYPEEEEEEEEEEGTEELSMTESDRLMLEELLTADEDEAELTTAENQRATARELIEYEQYLVDKNERLRRLEELQFRAGQTPPTTPTTPVSPFSECWPCPRGKICPQVCYPLSGPPPDWYGGNPPPVTPTPPSSPTQPPQSPTQPSPSQPIPTTPTTPSPQQPLPPSSQGGGFNPTRCANVYNGSCNSECSSGNAQLCSDCNSVCGTNQGSGGSGVYDPDRCDDEFNGSCGTECNNPNSSDCNTCRQVCGSSSSFARRSYEAWSDNILPAFTPPADSMELRLLYYTRGRY